ncbi:Phosphatidylinositol glycan anchor biosynthesis class U protein [Trichinella zimbabwensis]|uniref:Phosphatidylinositol glycan anchor biosynthesis class U protein n=1 Tax=Trichinella zimbabwensis TaxID=268475 RepID=A0A0V1I2C8_9BILA|nr:Phosphatidylinositol glycan anchor biosynthesis class U protein [Trichinella zimbabwensis]
MSTKEFFYICVAILLRMILSLCGLVEFLETRIEISTPFNSWIRVKEAFALQNAGFSPYSGDAVHCNPMLLIMLNFIDRNASWFTPFLFCLLDVIAAFLLFNATYLYRLKKHSVENLQKSQFAPNTKHLLLNENENMKMSQLVFLCYLFNPVVILSTVAKTTSTITNCLLSCVLFCFIKRKTVVCIFFLTMLLFVDVYFATLIIPVFLFVSQGGHFDWKKVVYLNLFFFQCLGCFALLSYLCFGDWSFLNSTIGAVLTLSDLTPNFGLYWYYFVEMFDHFRLFFLFVFHLCPFIYTIPLAINLRKDAFFLIYIQLLITTLFKSYPSIADFAVAYSLMPCFSHLFRYMQYRYLILFTWFTCMVLSPVMWYLWIDQGSANANFFFAITLVYLVAQVFLISDFLQAHFKRCFCLRHGESMLIDGENGVYVLEMGSRLLKISNTDLAPSLLMFSVYFFILLACERYLNFCMLGGIVLFLLSMPFLEWVHMQRINFGRVAMRAFFDELNLLSLPRSKGIRFDCCAPIEPPTMWIDNKKEDNIPDACQSQTASQTLTSTWPSENETLTTDKVNTDIVTTSNMQEQRRIDFERKRAEHYANEATIARQHFNESFPLNNITTKESSKDLQSSSAEDKEGKKKQNEEDLPNEAAGKKDKPEDSEEI